MFPKPGDVRLRGWRDAVSLKRGIRFRVSMKDEGGDEIRFIQQPLGHAELSTTQIYTQVSIQQLKQVHSATDPARLEPKRAARAETDSQRLPDRAREP